VGYRGLRNFGQLHTAKVPPQVQLSAVTWLAGQLGIISFPRYMTHLLSEDRRWKEFHFSEADKRGIKHKEFIEWVQKGIASYRASVGVCGQEKGEEIYSKFTEKQGLLCWESFFPTAADFAEYADPWEALRQYFLEYFRVNHSEGVFDFQVVRDTDSELHFKVIDCAWHAMFSEAGCPNLAHIGAQVDIIFLPRLLGEMGGDFRREHWICRGDTTCDWHFFQHKT
jgi:hypothetical protein